jgi:hypothetical protein
MSELLLSRMSNVRTSPEQDDRIFYGLLLTELSSKLRHAGLSDNARIGRSLRRKYANWPAR